MKSKHKSWLNNDTPPDTGGTPSGSDQLKIVYFIMFSLVASFFVVGLIPAVIILSKIYIMKKDNVFDPMFLAKDHVKKYIVLLSLLASTSAGITHYGENFRSIYIDPEFSLTERSIFSSRDSINEYIIASIDGFINADKVLSYSEEDMSVYLDYGVNNHIEIARYLTLAEMRAILNMLATPEKWYEYEGKLLKTYDKAKEEYSNKRILYISVLAIILPGTYMFVYYISSFFYGYLFFDPIFRNRAWFLSGRRYFSKINLSIPLYPKRSSKSDELLKWHALFEKGAISEDEYTKIKNKILN